MSKPFILFVVVTLFFWFFGHFLLGLIIGVVSSLVLSHRLANASFDEDVKKFFNRFK